MHASSLHVNMTWLPPYLRGHFQTKKVASLSLGPPPSPPPPLSVMAKVADSHTWT